MKDRAWLEALDIKRMDEPEEVARALEASAPGVRRSLLPFFCAVYGSTLRRLGRNLEARRTIQYGIIHCNDPRDLASLIQRFAFVESEVQLPGAIRLTDLATLYFHSAADRVGLGQTAVDKGKWLFEQECYREASSVLESALKLLPDTEEHKRNRFSALLGQGFCFEALGEVEKAYSYAEAADKIGEGVGSDLHASLWRIRARLAKRLGQLTESENLFNKIVAYYTEKQQPFFAATAAVELVVVQLELGELAKATETARGMAIYLNSLQKNRIAVGAITELVRASLTGTLTQACANAAKSALEKAQG